MCQRGSQRGSYSKPDYPDTEAKCHKTPQEIVVDMNDIQTTNTYNTIKMPIYIWQCEMTTGFCMFYEKENVPKWFYRHMSKLLLGWKWSRVNDHLDKK